MSKSLRCLKTYSCQKKSPNPIKTPSKINMPIWILKHRIVACRDQSRRSYYYLVESLYTGSRRYAPNSHYLFQQFVWKIGRVFQPADLSTPCRKNSSDPAKNRPLCQRRMNLSNPNYNLSDWDSHCTCAGWSSASCPWWTEGSRSIHRIPYFVGVCL